MRKVESWTEKQWKQNLATRLQQAKKYREQFENQWESNARIVYDIPVENYGLNWNEGTDTHEMIEDSDQASTNYGANYCFKYTRFLHSQTSSNPPSVVVRPNSSDKSDKLAADSADRILRYAYKKDRMQEHIDQTSLKTLTRGTGWIKIFWDVDGGDVDAFNEQSGEIQMQGEIKIYSPSIYDIWIDPTAKTWDEVRYIFERVTMPRDEAKFTFPEHKEKFQDSKTLTGLKSFFSKANEEEMVDVYVYYEKGMPSNGMAGRYAICLQDGSLLDQPKKNPHPYGKLPFHIFTDIDVEDCVYGKSNIDFVAKMQDLLNKFDSAAIEAMRTHGVVRMLVPNGVEIDDGDITNNNREIIRYSAEQGVPQPTFMNPPSLPSDLHLVREMLKLDLQEIFGINDAMLGVQKREQSGFSQQTSIEAGNMTRRRLFNKYASFVEHIYKDYIALVKKHWTDEHQIKVVGNEKAFETKYLSKSDLQGGFDIVVEYGASLPLEPSMRRESIMLLQPVLQQAGVEPKKILSLLKLNDLEGLYDTIQMAADKQQRIFDKMIDEDIFIQPEKFEDHEKMLAYCNDYVMTVEFEKLSDDHKALIYQHIEARMEAGQQALGGQATPQQPQQPAMPQQAMQPPPMV